MIAQIVLTFSLLVGGYTKFVMVAALGLLLWTIYKRTRAPPISGPFSFPIVGNRLQLDTKRPFLTLYKWCRKFGNIYKITLSGRDFVVVTGYDELTEVLVTRGMDFAGRCMSWTSRYAYKGKGIVHSETPDEQWRHLRHICHLHTRKISTENNNKLQELLRNISSAMFDQLEEASQTNSRYGVSSEMMYDAISTAAIRSMASLVLGINISEKDPLFLQLDEYCKMSSENNSYFGDRQVALLDRWPLLRYTGIIAFHNLNRMKALEKQLWQEIKSRLKVRRDRTSLGTLLLDAVEFPAKFKSVADLRITDFDAQRTAFSMYIAGVSSISHSFHSLVNVLAYNQHSQEKIFMELKGCLMNRKERVITLDDGPCVHYTRAAILEAFRYCSVSAFGRVHRAVVDTQIGDVPIQKNTPVITNLWGLHHDDNFWKDPCGFFPERFLDLTEKLVPADHPNRKRLFHFGAGPRMCIGESMASSRLFHWLTNFAIRYHVTVQSEDDVSTTCRDHVIEGGLLRSPPSKLVISKR